MSKCHFYAGLVMALAISPAVSGQELSAKDVFRKASQSVVLINVYDDEDSPLAQGSGVVVAHDMVASNCHVLSGKGSDYAIIEWQSSKIRIDGRNLRGQDSERDLCTLNAPGLNAPAAQIIDSKDISVGDKVYAIGAPEGLELTLSNGLVSGFREYKGAEYIQTTAPISHGSSGGGLFDAQGRLVGITTMFLKEGQSLNFAVPAELIASLPQLVPEQHEAMNGDQAAADAAQASADAAAQAADAAAISADDAAGPQQSRNRWREIFYYKPANITYYVDTRSLIRSKEVISAWIKSTSGYGSAWNVDGERVFYQELFQRIKFSCDTWEMLISEEYITDRQGMEIGRRDGSGPFTVSPTSSYDPIIAVMCSQ